MSQDPPSEAGIVADHSHLENHSLEALYRRNVARLEEILARADFGNDPGFPMRLDNALLSLKHWEFDIKLTDGLLDIIEEKHPRLAIADGFELRDMAASLNELADVLLHKQVLNPDILSPCIAEVESAISSFTSQTQPYRMALDLQYGRGSITSLRQRLREVDQRLDNTKTASQISGQQQIENMEARTALTGMAASGARSTTFARASDSSIKSVNDIRHLVYDDSLNTIYHPSPLAWEDQVLYFLLPDRFSDGNEKILFDVSQSENAVRSELDAWKWRDAGTRFVGGTIAGLHSKLPYLQRLGITTLWIGPIFKQVAWSETYHGYGVQNFLDVDPRFGTKEDLKSLVKSAHASGIYVLLDIILNHSGNVFAYVLDNTPYTGVTYAVRGFFAAQDDPSIPFGPVDDSHFPDGAVWPSELQLPECFTRKGHIQNWDSDPEFLDGDFFDLKDINLGVQYPDNFDAPPALRALCEVYKYWIAYTDIDGYRIDTVKHMGDGPTRYFSSVIHEYAAKLGKDRFLLMGEITGTRAFDTVQATGLDAALGIGAMQEQLWKVPQGDVEPKEYFDHFRNALYLNQGSHTWFRDKVVTMIDDHDQVWRGNTKGRFCSVYGNDRLVAAAVMLNLCTLGIPCIYYGTEQAFDGSGIDDSADRYIREAMFGGEFGAFRSGGVHFFDEQHPVYQAIAEVIKLRQSEMTLKRGRQYLRDISGDGEHFGPTRKIGDGPILGLIAWSRLFANEEILLAVNSDRYMARGAWVNVDAEIHPPGSAMRFLIPAGGGQVPVELRSGLAAVQLRTVEAGGFVILK